MDAGDDIGAMNMVPTLMFESNNNSKAKARINIAEAKGLSSVIVDNDYDAWERFQNMMMVSKTARVNEREKKERIQKEICMCLVRCFRLAPSSFLCITFS